MTFVADVPIGKIALDAPVLLCVSDQLNHTQSFHSTVSCDASDLSSALVSILRQLRAQLPLPPPPQDATHILPSGFINADKAHAQAASKEAGPPLQRTVQEIKHVKYGLD